MKEEEAKILDAFEAANPEGASSIEILAVLSRLGVVISEPSLRKYVQVGLLPRSRRVGTKGRHQGSWGIYPPWTARQVVEIKRQLAEGRTLQEISEGYLSVYSRCKEAAEALRDIEERLGKLGKKENIDAHSVLEIKEVIGRAAGLAENAAEKTIGRAEFVEIAI